MSSPPIVIGRCADFLDFCADVDDAEVADVRFGFLIGESFVCRLEVIAAVAHLPGSLGDALGLFGRCSREIRWSVALFKKGQYFLYFLLSFLVGWVGIICLAVANGLA